MLYFVRQHFQLNFFCFFVLLGILNGREECHMLHIKRFRTECRMTQKELAKAVNKSYVTIQSWEKGTSYPNAESILDMCDLFDCTPNDLLGWYDNHPRPIEEMPADRRALISSYDKCDKPTRASILMVAKNSALASVNQACEQAETNCA